MTSLSVTTTTAGTVSPPHPTASSIFVNIELRDTIQGTSDFTPFHDLAQLTNIDNPFSFTDLIEDGIGGGQQLNLYQAGCQISEGHSDCTVACTNTSLYFGSLETFYNCAAIASVSYWTNKLPNYYVGPEAEHNASSIMGSGTLGSFNSTPVFEEFISCAQAACAVDGLSQPCNDNVHKLSNSSAPKEVFDAMDTFCPTIIAQLNPDIFGPGVSRYFLSLKRSLVIVSLQVNQVVIAWMPQIWIK